MYILKVVVSNDPVKIKFTEELTEKCGSVEGERCDQAFAFAKCIHTEVMNSQYSVDLF